MADRKPSGERPVRRVAGQLGDRKASLALASACVSVAHGLNHADAFNLVVDHFNIPGVKRIKTATRRTYRPRRALPTGKAPSDVTRDAITLIAFTFGASYAEVMGKSRLRRIAVARHAVYVVLHGAGKAYAEIGRMIGRDHTSVIAGCRADKTDERRRLKINAAAVVSAVTIAMLGKGA